MQSIAVFCGSQNGNNPVYALHTRQLARLLAARNIHVVYGGGKAGLMGIVADAALEAGGRVTGIIPFFLNSQERKHEGVTELIVTQTMHERKKLLFEKCDAAIVLPGGFGTLDELFELVTWNQLQLHHKKLFILNSGGYYNTLRQHIELMYNEGFLYSNPFEEFNFIDEPEELERLL
jgi:uncharacterized protein (TIGR00730 family)